MRNTVHQLPAEALLQAQASDSIDLIAVDPPFRTTRLALDSRRPIDWNLWWAEAQRVLKPAGIVVMFASGAFMIDQIVLMRDYYRYQIIWEKSRAMGFLSANPHRLLTGD